MAEGREESETPQFYPPEQKPSKNGQEMKARICDDNQPTLFVSSLPSTFTNLQILKVKFAKYNYESIGGTPGSPWVVKFPNTAVGSKAASKCYREWNNKIYHGAAVFKLTLQQSGQRLRLISKADLSSPPNGVRPPEGSPRKRRKLDLDGDHASSLRLSSPSTSSVSSVHNTPRLSSPQQTLRMGSWRNSLTHGKPGSSIRILLLQNELAKDASSSSAATQCLPITTKSARTGTPPAKALCDSTLAMPTATPTATPPPSTRTTSKRKALSPPEPLTMSDSTNGEAQAASLLVNNAHIQPSNQLKDLSKPSGSFVDIMVAIMQEPDSPELWTSAALYDKIREKHPYYAEVFNQSTLKNNISSYLSQNRAFVKHGFARDTPIKGTASYWRLDPQYKKGRRLSTRSDNDPPHESRESSNRRRSGTDKASVGSADVDKLYEVENNNTSRFCIVSTSTDSPAWHKLPSLQTTQRLKNNCAVGDTVKVTCVHAAGEASYDFAKVFELRQFDHSNVLVAVLRYRTRRELFPGLSKNQQKKWPRSRMNLFIITTEVAIIHADTILSKATKNEMLLISSSIAFDVVTRYIRPRDEGDLSWLNELPLANSRSSISALADASSLQDPIVKKLTLKLSSAPVKAVPTITHPAQDQALQNTDINHEMTHVQDETHEDVDTERKALLATFTISRASGSWEASAKCSRTTLTDLVTADPKPDLASQVLSDLGFQTERINAQEEQIKVILGEIRQVRVDKDALYKRLDQADVEMHGLHERLTERETEIADLKLVVLKSEAATSTHSEAMNNKLGELRDVIAGLEKKRDTTKQGTDIDARITELVTQVQQHTDDLSDELQQNFNRRAEQVETIQAAVEQIGMDVQLQKEYLFPTNGTIPESWPKYGEKPGEALRMQWGLSEDFVVYYNPEDNQMWCRNDARASDGSLLYPADCRPVNEDDEEEGMEEDEA